MTVKQQQALLVYLGFNPGQVDGLAGPKTSAAMDAFLAAYGLTGLQPEEQMDSLVGAVAGSILPLEREAGADPDDPFDGIIYFTPAEFKCHCGGAYCDGKTAVMDHQLLTILDGIRDHYGVPVTVTSGIRCRTHNSNVGGVPKSKHMTGQAADIIVRGHSASEVTTYAAQLMGVSYTYAIDGGAVHINV